MFSPPGFSSTVPPPLIVDILCISNGHQSQANLYLFFANVNSEGKLEILVKISSMRRLFCLVVDNRAQRIEHCRVVEGQVVPSDWTIQYEFVDVAAKWEWKDLQVLQADSN